MEELAAKLGLKGAKLLDKRVVRFKVGISTDIRFRRTLSIFPAFSVSSSAIIIH